MLVIVFDQVSTFPLRFFLHILRSHVSLLIGPLKGCCWRRSELRCRQSHIAKLQSIENYRVKGKWRWWRKQKANGKEKRKSKKNGFASWLKHPFTFRISLLYMAFIYTVMAHFSFYYYLCGRGLCLWTCPFDFSLLLPFAFIAFLSLPLSPSLALFSPAKCPDVR